MVATPSKRPVKRSRVGAAKSSSQVVSIPKSLGPFARRTTRTLRYVQNIGLVVTSGFGNHCFRTNSLFDPDRTGVGHQPMGFDQLMGLYFHYRVRKSTIKATPLTNFAANDTAILCLTVNPSSVADTSILTACERQGAKFMVASSQENMRRGAMHKWDAKDYFSNPSADSLAGQVGTNPAEESFYQIYWQDYNLVSFTMELLVEMTFDVEFFEPVGFAAS